MSHVKEVVVFRLKKGTDEAVFQKDAQATFDLLQSYDGYVDRELGVSEDGTWIDMVTWADLQTALQAAEKLIKNPIGLTFVAHIDPDTTQMVHTQLRITDRT